MSHHHPKYNEGKGVEGITLHGKTWIKGVMMIRRTTVPG